MTRTIFISVAKDFSTTPGPRSTSEGDFSGEAFLDLHLRPRYLEAVKEGAKLKIDLDGTEGYATSFLEAAFGGLARQYPCETILQTLEFNCEDEPMLRDEINTYIKEARKQ
jgi:STAS-like domain of unknown function (DUF4325)